jgi:two-component system, chemotaxis family, chemotaxis protein CheY
MCLILIVDDRESEMFATWLTAAGLTAFAADSGKAALKWLKLNDADVVLVDLAMPYPMDGITFIEHLSPEQYRVAVLTGHPVTDMTRDMLRRRGVEKIFYKGTDISKVITAIKNWLL